MRSATSPSAIERKRRAMFSGAERKFFVAMSLPNVQYSFTDIVDIRAGENKYSDINPNLNDALILIKSIVDSRYVAFRWTTLLYLHQSQNKTCN